MDKVQALLLIVILPSLFLAQSDKIETKPVSTKDVKLTPRTVFDGPQLKFDFPSVHIGVAEYEEGPTGATVFYFPKRAVAAVDVRGGAPGTTNIDWLELGYDFPSLDAVCFAGGSWFGLEASSGVRAELLATTRPDPLSVVANVAGAIVFDFRARTNSIYPDHQLGRAALRAARPNRFLLGARGAGRYVHVGKFPTRSYMERSGQGGAFRQVGQTKIAVFTVVNALGGIVDRQGKVLRGFRDAETGNRITLNEVMKRMSAKAEASLEKEPAKSPQNTTLTIVITNQKLAHWQLRRLAMQVHTSMARGIQPFQAQADGDVLFSVSTGEIENPNLSLDALAIIASDAAYDAILSSVTPNR